ncbi:ThrRS/AlaRS common domain-containing protein [Martensiomyces pterosporus]|nr:ThrRS/AlaRS common domain-containing protein [Martensiomyces pterosporus]
MATKLAYFDDTYKFTGAATVVEVAECSSVADPDLSKAVSKHPFAVVLDETLFYPQGGGQPTDVGQLTSGTGATFSVQHVIMYQGQVYHLGLFTSGSFSAGDSVDLHVDQQTRLQNARCHSGGHVIFSIVKGTQWPMVEKKGHHFADGAYVEFKGVMPEDEDKEAFQKRVDHVVQADLPVRAYTLQDGELRYVRVGDFVQNPCGGTHVRSTGEIGRIVIKKIARRKGQDMTKISYSVVAAQA